VTGKDAVRAGRALSPLLLLPFTGCSQYALLDPQGSVGAQEKTLILLALGVMLLVVIPVIALTLVFAWRYRETNTQATYAPRWAHSTGIEVVVWSIPCLIVAFLSVLIWNTTHVLDPYRPLDSAVKPVNVDVVALNWKWLFIYPDYGIATVNRLEIPANTPINFKLTSDSIMNSFFIPQLGSQVYAMAGMQTQLHLIADAPGIYEGRSSAFSGPGFSDMHFDTVATYPEAFAAWVRTAKASSAHLDDATYTSLAQPSSKTPVMVYGDVVSGLFDSIVAQFMPGPMHSMTMNKSISLPPSQADATRSMN
jgi:cytochrome o ubiquinol oxidase subunit 2